MIKILKNYKFELLLLLFSVFLLSGYVYSQYKQIEINYFNHTHNQVTKLLVLDTKIDHFIQTKYKLVQIDTVNDYLAQSLYIINELILENQNKPNSMHYTQHLELLKKDFLKKELAVERIKYTKAFEFNIRSYLLDTQEKSFNDLPLDLKNKLNKIKINVVNKMQQEKNLNDYIHSLEFSQEELQRNYIQNFLNKLEALNNSVKTQERFIKNANDIEFNKTILKTKEILLEISQERKMWHSVITNIFVLTTIFLLIAIIYYHRKLKSTHQYLLSFKTAVENSYNVVVMTDVNRNIIFANHMFEKVTGYKRSEALGNNPRVLKSGIQDDDFYKQMNEVLSKGQNWKGRFINKDKFGNLFYEDATIAPIFNGSEISGYLAIKNDVTQNVLYEEKLKQLNEELIEKNEMKEKLLIEQTKLATLGEMMDAVAHQWKQPLNIISSYASTLQLQKQLGIMNDDLIEDVTDTIIKQINHLAITLDEFRKFFREDVSVEKVNIKRAISSVLELQKTFIDANNMEIQLKCSDDIHFDLIVTEFKHILINLINNACDAFIENLIEERFIFIDVTKDEKSLYVQVTDNAGGIPERIIPRIFEQNFTTKEKDRGTGIGLYMCQRFVQKANGEISVKNIKQEINGQMQKGARFSIVFHKLED